jgi:hypothetical protein
VGANKSTRPPLKSGLLKEGIIMIIFLSVGNHRSHQNPKESEELQPLRWINNRHGWELLVVLTSRTHGHYK